MVVLVDKSNLSADMEAKLRDVFEKTGAEKIDEV
jgi:hypothetical protein